MSAHAVVLLTLAAFLHATWNLIGKRQSPSASLLMMSNAIAAFLMLPIPLYYWQGLPAIPADVWVLLGLTGLANAAYFAALAGAYRTGQMSIAYPLMRSVPVLLVTGISALTGPGHSFGLPYLCGIAMVVVGCFLLPLSRPREFRLANCLDPTGRWALLAACATAAYTIIDNRALAQLRGLGGFSNVQATLLYATLEATSVAVCLAAFSLTWAGERQRLWPMLRGGKTAAAGVGIAMYLGYGLVLASMAHVEDVSYVMAFRQLSIPIGVVYGVVLLKEPCPLPKVAGVGFISAGLLLVGLG
jgi:drug/metabolite transporter (DMT)-like permease